MGCSDLYKNRSRVDIVLVKDKKRTKVKDIIEQIKDGKTILYVNYKVGKNCYKNKLCRELNRIGIEDVRFGSTSWQLQSESSYASYTLYK